MDPPLSYQDFLDKQCLVVSSLHQGSLQKSTKKEREKQAPECFEELVSHHIVQIGCPLVLSQSPGKVCYDSWLCYYGESPFEYSNCSCCSHQLLSRNDRREHPKISKGIQKDGECFINCLLPSRIHDYWRLSRWQMTWAGIHKDLELAQTLRICQPPIQMCVHQVKQVISFKSY